MARTNYPRAMPNANTLLHTPQWKQDGVGLKGIICLHGRGGSSTLFAQGYGFGLHPTVLADAGFDVLAVDMGGASWNNGNSSDAANVSAMGAVKAAYNELKNVVGIAGTKIGLMGWSMGGGAALQFIKQNPSLVACAWLFNTLSDLDYFHQTAGYVPPYSTGGLTPNPAFPAEIDAAYGNNYAVNAVGHKIHDEKATWRGLGIRIMHCQASDDTVVPPAADADFVAGVNDPNVTLYSPAPTGGHSGAMAAIDPAIIRDFFLTYLKDAA